MKRFIILIALLIGAFHTISAQDGLPREFKFYNTSKSSEISNENSADFVAKWIERMYNDKLYEDYDFLQKHCSAKLLKKLQEAYTYDADSIAYATWLFRSGRQDSKPGADDKSIVLEVKVEGEWYVYTALDMGWKFTNKIKVSNKNGEIVIDDLCTAKD